MFTSRQFAVGCLILVLGSTGCGKIKEKVEADVTKKGQAGTPQEAVELYVAACKKKSIGGVLKLLHPTVRKVVAAHLRYDSNKASEAYERAENEKFGKAQDVKAPEAYRDERWEPFANQNSSTFAYLALESLEIVSEEKKDEDRVVLKCKATRFNPKNPDGRLKPEDLPYEKTWVAVELPAEKEETKGLHRPKSWKLIPPELGKDGKLGDADLARWEWWLASDSVKDNLADVKRTVQIYEAEIKAIKAGKYKTAKEAAAGVSTAFAIANAPTYTGFGLGDFQLGDVRYFRVTGKEGESVFGSGPYHFTSNLASAAVHAGVLKVGQTGLVKVTLIAGPGPYKGSTKNGIRSVDAGPNSEAYTVALVKK
jgi:hypothetical protein